VLAPSHVPKLENALFVPLIQYLYQICKNVICLCYRYEDIYHFALGLKCGRRKIDSIF
jgi:hypothetical protein